jgi:hypothetical protein
MENETPAITLCRALGIDTTQAIRRIVITIEATACTVEILRVIVPEEIDQAVKKLIEERRRFELVAIDPAI